MYFTRPQDGNSSASSYHSRLMVSAAWGVCSSAVRYSAAGVRTVMWTPVTDLAWGLMQRCERLTLSRGEQDVGGVAVGSEPIMAMVRTREIEEGAIQVRLHHWGVGASR